jgi:hypothetical protein
LSSHLTISASRLAYLNLHEFFEAFGKKLRCAGQNICALFTGGLAPSGKGVLGSLNRTVDVSSVSFGDQSQRFAGRWVLHLEGLPGFRRHVLPVDKHVVKGHSLGAAVGAFGMGLLNHNLPSKRSSVYP